MKIIIILILIFILFIIYKNLNTENYNAKVNNLDINTCARTCSKLYGCSGFSHKEIDNTCYFSHLPINNNPLGSVYDNEYDKNDIICNKVLPIISDFDISKDMYRDNLTYNCFTNVDRDLGRNYFGMDDNSEIPNNNLTFSCLRKNNRVVGIKYTYENLNNPYVEYDTVYDLNYIDPTRQRDWESLPKTPLTYINPYQVKINEPNIDFIQITDSSNNLFDISNNNDFFFQTCDHDIDLETCKNLCKNDYDCKSIEFIDNINNANNHNNICCLKSNIIKTNKNSNFFIKKIT